MLSGLNNPYGRRQAPDLTSDEDLTVVTIRFPGKTMAAAAVLAVLASASHGAQDSVALTTGAAGSVISVTSVDEMPPQMRTAYLSAIRIELRAHGYESGEAGGFDDRLVAAIRTYQRDARLPADGVASKELLDHLMFVLPKVYAPGAAPTQAGVQPEFPAARVTRSPVDFPNGDRQGRFKGVPPNSPFKVIPPLSPEVAARGGLAPGLKGMKREPVATEELAPLPKAKTPRPATETGGGVVTRLQRTLKRLGYYKGPVDGTHNKELADAIRRYQQDNRLPATGKIDGPLLNTLLSQSGRRE